MTTDRQAFERRFGQRLDAHAAAVVRPFDAGAVTRRAVERETSRPGLRGWADRLVRPDAAPTHRRFASAAVTLLLAGMLVLLAASVLLVGTRPADPTQPLDWPDLGLHATGSLVEPRACHSAVLLDDGRVLVVGGRTVDGDVVTGPELYDPASGTFRALDSSTVAGDGASATKLADGRVLIAGGRGRLPDGEGPGYCTMYDAAETSGDEELGAAFLFDPRTERLERTSDLRSPRSGHIAALLGDGRVLIAGGNGVDADGVHGPLASAELFDPRTGTFSETGDMSVARGWQRALSGIMTPTAVTLPDGRVVVTGGVHAADEPEPDMVFDTDDVYDPGADRFTRAKPADHEPTLGPWLMLTNCRFPCLFRFDPVVGQRSTSWQGPDGRYHGINGGSAWLLSGEHLLLVTGREVGLHDLAKDKSWYADSVVTKYRINATATALAEGRVLIVGGFDQVSEDGPSIVTNAAEIAGPASSA